MGPSQSSNLQQPPNFTQLFSTISEYKQINNKSQHALPLFRHICTGKLAEVRTFQFQGPNKSPIECYYMSRTKLNKNPYIFQLLQSKIITSKMPSHHEKQNQILSNPCTMKNVKTKHQKNGELNSLCLFVEASNICLEDQIVKRANKKPFEEIQLWSVLSSSVLGAIALIQGGFKEPVLSPKGIGLSTDGVVKVGQWELVSKINQSALLEEGQIFFGKLGQPVSENHKNSLHELLISYYWAPEGLKAIQSFINLGQKQPQKSNSHRNRPPNFTSNKFQIFSLGMTLISMCLRNCYYRTQTFSQKQLSKLTHQAIQIRRVEGKELSVQMKTAIEAMVKWDPVQRISYSELRELILSYLSQHADQMKDSQVSIRTFQNLSQGKNGKIFKKNHKSRTESLTSNLSSVNFNQGSISQHDFTLADGDLNFKSNKGFQKCQANQEQSSMSSYFVYEGSGMVEQGTGDDDHNLRDEKQQIFLQEEKNLSSPVTHRTQKQLKDKNLMSKSSPEIKIESSQAVVCPTSTPISFPSPIAVKNDRIRMTPPVHKSPYLVLESTEDYEPPQPKNNKIYLTQQQKSTENNMLSSTSNRGSYRSFHKQPPNIKSARLDTKSIEIPSLSDASQSHRYSLNGTMKFRNEVIVQFASGSPENLQLPMDFQDGPNRIGAYFIINDPQLQNPDIFETFAQETESQQSRTTISLQTIEKYPISSYLYKLQSNLPQNTCSETKKPYESNSSSKDNQYMTFNQKFSLAEDSFVPSKWDKPAHRGTLLSQTLKRQQQQNLFTDPKLMQYIRSPIRPPAQKNSVQITSRFNDNEKKDKENSPDFANKSILSNKQTIVHLFSSFSKSPIEDLKTSLISENFNSDLHFNYTKIVKQQVAKGFYQGQKKNGLRCGYGVFYYNEGGKYKGNWLNNKMHGKGTLEYADGRIAYQGDWNCDQLHGKGVLYNQSPNFVTTALNYADLDELDECWIFYQGTFQHDDKCGMGLLLLSNHEQFIGEFRNDMAEGMGEYLKIDGTTVKGIWHHNKLVKIIEQSH